MVASILETLGSFIVSTIDSLGYVGVVVLMAIESANIPLPSEVIMPFAGFLAGEGRFTMFGAALAGALGCTLGSALSYWVGMKGGRPLIERYGKYVLISRHDLDLADRWFARWGDATAFFSRLLPVVAAMIATGVAGAWIVARRRGPEVATSATRIQNPFSLKQAFTWAIIYGVVLLVARGATEYLGQGGVFAVAALSAVADVDAVTIAYTQLGAREGLWRVPAAAIALAAVINTLVKLGIAWMRGAGSFRPRVAAALGAMALAGAAAGVVVYLRG